jgi:hypothetical protein
VRRGEEEERKGALLEEIGAHLHEGLRRKPCLSWESLEMPSMEAYLPS